MHDLISISSSGKLMVLIFGLDYQNALVLMTGRAKHAYLLMVIVLLIVLLHHLVSLTLKSSWLMVTMILFP
jgi:hypothetical protein